MGRVKPERPHVRKAENRENPHAFVLVGIAAGVGPNSWVVWISEDGKPMKKRIPLKGSGKSAFDEAVIQLKAAFVQRMTPIRENVR